nr:hypothetical protein [Bradyrhizobium sp. CCBAU 51745]
MSRSKMEAGTVRYAGDVAVADGALEWGRRVAPLDLVDGDAFDPVVQDDGTLAPRQKFELAVAIALQEVRYVAPKRCPTWLARMPSARPRFITGV